MDRHTYDLYPLKVEYMTFKNFTYIIVDRATRYAAVVDPSWEWDTLSDKLKQLNVQVVAILLTHSHRDHVNLVSKLQETYQPQVYMSRLEATYHGYTCPNLTLLEDEDTIQLGDTKIRCLLTPGHSAGSMCYLLSHDILTGDTIFIEGCGMCSGNGGDPAMMFESIQRVKQVVGDHVRVYPGHSYGEQPGHPMSYLHRYNIYFAMENKDSFIQFRMRKNQRNLFGFR